MATIKSDYILPNYDPEEVGMKGEKGDDGKTSYVHIAYANSADGGVDFSTTDATNRAYTGYYTDFEMIDSTDPSKYEWQRVKGDTGKDGVAGKDGVGLSSTSITYAASTSASVAPSGGWTTQVPTVAEGSYLWTKTVWNYTDNTSETGYSVARMGADGDRGQDGIAGKDGVGIKTTLIEYAVNTSGTVRPTTGWTTTIPSTPQGQYLWTRTTWTYTDNTTEQGYSVARQGSNGATGPMGPTGATGKDGVAGKDGVGLSYTVITYAASASGTTAPSTGWQVQVPTVAPNNYLWTRTVWTYTDNTSETGYSVAKMGADGAKGNDGIAGKDGVGIKSTLVEYVVSVTGTNAPASGWSTTIPVTPEGQYLWTRTKWTYTDNTTEVGYSVAKQGAKGATGSTGATGPTGVGIASTIIEYNKSTSSTIKPTTGWTSAIPSISGGEFLWTRTTLNYTNSTKAESYTVSRQGQDGSDGQLFTGEFAPTNFNEGDLWYKVVSGKVTAVFKATSGQWIEVPFDSSVIAETIVGKTIQASHLTGSTIEGGNITGAEINGSVINGGEFNNTFTENVGTNATLTGNTTIQRGIVETQYNINDTETGAFLASGRQTWNGVNIESVQNGADGLAAASSTFGATGIDIYNKEHHSQFGMVHLGYQDLMTLPKKEITEYSPDFEPYSVGQEPSAERYMRTVQLYGAFKNKNKIPANVGHEPLYMGTLPVGYRPSGTVRFVVPGSGVTRYVLQINNNGRMYMYNMGGWNGSSYTIVDVNPGSWLNVQCNFIAGNI